MVVFDERKHAFNLHVQHSHQQLLYLYNKQKQQLLRIVIEQRHPGWPQDILCTIISVTRFACPLHQIGQRAQKGATKLGCFACTSLAFQPPKSGHKRIRGRGHPSACDQIGYGPNADRNCSDSWAFAQNLAKTMQRECHGAACQEPSAWEQKTLALNPNRSACMPRPMCKGHTLREDQQGAYNYIIVVRSGTSPS